MKTKRLEFNRRPYDGVEVVRLMGSRPSGLEVWEVVEVIPARVWDLVVAEMSGQPTETEAVKEPT